MQSENKILDDIVRVAGGAASALGGLKDQIRNEIRHRVDNVLANMDLVRREEFTALETMVSKARMEQQRLEKRITELENKLGVGTTATKSTAQKKSTAKKTVPQKKSAKTTGAKKTKTTKTTTGKKTATSSARASNVRKSKKS